jgi:hypothetical protein
MKSLRAGFGCRHAGRVSTHVLQRLMRHKSIQVTMDYYANVDDAVEEAILGNSQREGPAAQDFSIRNSSRNSRGAETTAPDPNGDASPYQDGSSV